jgi:hypothetical protein
MSLLSRKLQFTDKTNTAPKYKQHNFDVLKSLIQSNFTTHTSAHFLH